MHRGTQHDPVHTASLLAYIQGTYFVGFGAWPIFHVESFQHVTGPKTDHLVSGSEADHWLVYTVALQLIAAGIVLLVAAWRRSIFLEVALLGLLSSTALIAIDLIYVIRGVIPPVYLLDAMVETFLTGAWIVILHRKLSRRRS